MVSESAEKEEDFEDDEEPEKSKEPEEKWSQKNWEDLLLKVGFGQMLL